MSAYTVTRKAGVTPKAAPKGAGVRATLIARALIAHHTQSQILADALVEHLTRKDA